MKRLVEYYEIKQPVQINAPANRIGKNAQNL